MTHTIAQTQASSTFSRVKPILDALQQIIEAAGPDGIPSGHLYAMLMGHMDLGTYQSMINLMVKAGGITLNHHVLRAVAK